MQITIIIDGKEYILNKEKATELGILTPVSRPLIVSDLEQGDIFFFNNFRHFDRFMITEVMPSGHRKGINISKDDIHLYVWEGGYLSDTVSKLVNHQWVSTITV